MKPRCAAWALILFSVCMLSLTSISARDLNGVEILTGTWNGEPIEYLDKEVLVGLNAGITQQEFVDELGLLNVEIVRDADRFGFLKLKVDRSEMLFELIDHVKELESVRFAEPNMVDHTFIIPNDPEFDKQWHYHNTGQNPPGGTVDADIDAPEGWDVSTGGTVIRVGVLDSGIPIQLGSLSHPDLDDPTRYFFGYDFSNGDNEPADDNGHGTHVSGTIAAESDNGIGVAGVCWNAEILAIKVFDQYGSGSHENFRDGCIYATDNGCKVINYSGGGSAGEAKEHGVAYADSHGVVVCAAAGNNWQGSVSWPGAYSTSYSNVICVSSTDHNDASSPFSSIGPSVTISAPG
ncbi:MAG: S8 family serine peptidase, partial [candidate division Zixibacteria bacterium]|nr:S8 family serine peptidase [candidate division Zixibacteria bacterium]